MPKEIKKAADEHALLCVSSHGMYLVSPKMAMRSDDVKMQMVQEDG